MSNEITLLKLLVRPRKALMPFLFKGNSKVHIFSTLRGSAQRKSLHTYQPRNNMLVFAKSHLLTFILAPWKASRSTANSKRSKWESRVNS